MRSYSRVAPSFWVGTTGRALRAEGSGAILAALYLITCPSANMTGLFYLPLVTMAHETGMSLEMVKAALPALANTGFAFYDETEESFWVPEMAKFQLGERLDPSDKQCKGVQTAIKPMMKSVFYRAFWERYHTDFHLPDITTSTPTEANKAPLTGPYDGDSKALPSPSGVPSKSLPCQDQYQDQCQDHLQVQEKEPTQDHLPGGSLVCGLDGVGLVPSVLGISPDGEQPGPMATLVDPEADWVDFGDENEMGGPVVPVQESPGSPRSSDGPGGTLDPEVTHGSVPLEVQEVFDIWDRACVEGTPYAKVPENQKPDLIPMVRLCLPDPEWKAKFTRFVSQMMHVPFYAGRVPSTTPGRAPFVPFFRWMVMKGPRFIDDHLTRLEDELKRIQHSSRQAVSSSSNGGTSKKTHLRAAGDAAYLQGLEKAVDRPKRSEPSSPNPLVTRRQQLMQKEQTNG